MPIHMGSSAATALTAGPANEPTISQERTAT